MMPLIDWLQMADVNAGNRKEPFVVCTFGLLIFTNDNLNMQK